MTYTCAICGKSYNKISDRARCEINCAAAEEKRKKTEEEKRLKTERVMFEKKIETKLNELEELINTYYERYSKLPDMSYILKNDGIKFTVGNSNSVDEKDKKFESFTNNDIFKDIINSLIF